MQAPMIDKQDVAKLLDHASTMKRPAHYNLLIILMDELGLRPIELAKLERSWFRGKELRIPTGQSKRGRARTLRYREAIAEALEAHMGDRQGRLFLNRQGEPFTPAQMSTSVRRLFAEAGVTGSCYSARRAMASRLVEKNVNIITLQKILGHASADTTARYVTVTSDAIDRALYA